MTLQELIKKQRKEFNNRFELEAQGCSECGGFELIDKTKIRFPKGKYYCEFDLEAVFEWHMTQLKKFIDQEIERKNGMRKEIPPYGNLSQLRINCAYNECLDEDITHLTSLKELIK